MRFRSIFSPRRADLGPVEKLVQVNWGLVLLITGIACIGFAMQYSAAGASVDPWASRQMARYAVGLLLLLLVAVIDIRIWFRYAYAIYAIAVLLLIAVEIAGRIGMGAQRWLELGPVQLQPAEIMKIGLVLALARWFHGLTPEGSARLVSLVWPAMLTLPPAILVLRQPKLGTAAILLFVAGAMAFLAGARLRVFGAAAAAAAIAVPVGWSFLRDYQKQRVLTFLNPENDPLGAGYHIIQSKIALGSGGVWGKGYLLGTQSHLQFLPEKQTDFIFTMYAEEFGMAGGIALIGLYALVLLYGTMIALQSKSQFGRLVAGGIMATFWVYTFVNMAMVTGLMPVVGEPLPFVSYGGSALMTLLVSFGLVINVYVHRDVWVGRYGIGDGG